MQEKSEEEKVKFKSRSDSIFGCLDVLEKKHEKVVTFIDKQKQREEEKLGGDHMSLGECSPSGASDCRNNVRAHRRNDQGNFDRRRRPAKKADHVNNPEKWQKYSLREDGSKSLRKGISADQLNRKIAMDFIDTLQKRNETNETVDEAEGCSKPVFKKPKQVETISKRSDFGSAHSGGAVVMEAFEFGQKTTAAKKPVTKNTTEQHKSVDKVALDFSFDKNDEEKIVEESSNINEPIDEPIEEKTVEKVTFKKNRQSRRAIRKKNYEEDENDA